MNTDTPRLRLGTHSNGQTALFDSVGLVCTMEAGSQSKRDADAAYLIGLERESAAMRAAIASKDATIARLKEALTDIHTWCENARRSTGIKPYGLDVARTALNQE